MKYTGTRSRIGKILAIGTVLSVALSACQKNPDSSVVVNKDMDNLIEEAQNTETGIVEVGEAVGNYDTYQTELSDESLQVSVCVDAQVDIPQSDYLSVIRVNQMEITQELVDHVIQELMGNDTLYDGAVTQSRTKQEIEAEIQSIQEQMNALTLEEVGGDEHSLEVYKSEHQAMIDSLQEEYESADASVNWENYESDGKLHTVEELYSQNTEDAFYAWEYDLNPDGEVLYAVTDADASQRESIYVQNNESFGNCIRYIKGSVGIDNPYAVTVDSSDLDQVNHIDGLYGAIWRTEDSPASYFLSDYGFEDASELKDVSAAATTITMDEAIDAADDFLDTVGIQGFEYYTGDLYGEACWYSEEDDSETIGYQTYYILQYMRNIDGAFVTFDSTSKHEEGWSGDDYVKNTWPIECIEFRINDDGIVAFSYNAPIETTEVVVEQSAIKSFEDIKTIFEQMVLVTNATNEEGVNININIDRVVLGYARVSEADSYDTGLLVPVWDFKGTITYSDNYSWYGSVLTINAIDGSVVDRSLGY